MSVTVPNRYGSAASGASGPPCRRAPRLGPRPFSISVVNSLERDFVGTGYSSIHETISSSIELPLLLSGAKY